MKVGTVCIIGRPNVGKSTLLNHILGRKASITSPKPQTTRSSLSAVYEDERGQIIFVDTPGIFSKANDSLSKHINPSAEKSLKEGVDVVVHMVDHTRTKDREVNRVLGIVRKVKAPKILAMNKIDIKEPSFDVSYKFMEEEHDDTVHLSALTGKNIPELLDAIYAYLPEGKKLVDTTEMVQPALNMDSKTYIAEIIREKAFLFLRSEVPYSLTSIVDEVTERENGTLYIKARILTSADRYKAMIIGKGGRMIKEISMAARKELEIARNKKVFIDLTVETDTHWKEFA